MAGLPVAGVDPDRLPAPVRDILTDWSQYWSELVKKAHEKR